MLPGAALEAATEAGRAVQQARGASSPPLLSGDLVVESGGAAATASRNNDEGASCVSGVRVYDAATGAEVPGVEWRHHDGDEARGGALIDAAVVDRELDFFVAFAACE